MLMIVKLNKFAFILSSQSFYLAYDQASLIPSII